MCEILQFSGSLSERVSLRRYEPSALSRAIGSVSTKPQYRIPSENNLYLTGICTIWQLLITFNEELRLVNSDLFHRIYVQQKRQIDVNVIERSVGIQFCIGRLGKVFSVQLRLSFLFSDRAFRGLECYVNTYIHILVFYMCQMRRASDST